MAANLWLLQGKSLAARPSVISFGTNFTETSFMPKSCPNLLSEWTVLKQMKAPIIKELSNCYFLVIQHSRTLCHHQLVPARGGPPWTFITLDWCPSYFQLPKPLLNLRMAHCLIPKSLMNQITGFWVWVPKFLVKCDADMLLNFLGRQCDTHDIWFWLTASDLAI